MTKRSVSVSCEFTSIKYCRMCPGYFSLVVFALSCDGGSLVWLLELHLCSKCSYRGVHFTVGSILNLIYKTHHQRQSEGTFAPRVKIQSKTTYSLFKISSRYQLEIKKKQALHLHIVLLSTIIRYWLNVSSFFPRV